MTFEKIIKAWGKRQFKPVYWLEGEEYYELDKIVNFAEHHILPENEASFNLTVFYGRDTNWSDVINTCRRYPMFGNLQVVIIKEAQNLKEIDKLEPYISQPMASTVLIIAYKDKKIDSRTRFGKLIKEKTELVSTKKLYDNKLPEWVSGLVNGKGFQINPKATALLVEHIGNDLIRIENEVDKVIINLHHRKNITEDDIENFIGISKEYNMFEFQKAIASRNLPKAIHIVQYFGANPDAAPLPLLFASLYSFFSKVYMVSHIKGGDDEAIAAEIGVSRFFVKDYLAALRQFNVSGIRQILLVLHQYNLKSIGVHAAPMARVDLLKEMVAKMLL